MSTYTIYELLGTVVRDDNVIVSPAQSLDDPDFVAYQQWIAEGNSPTIDNTTSLSVDDYKISRKEEINEFRDAILSGGHIDGNGVAWDTNQQAIQNLSGACALIAAGAITSNMTWRDKTNTNHTLSPAQIVGLSGAIAVFTQTAYGVSWYHKANIDALTTYEDITAYDITVGWPT